jgi:competence protein ComEA
MRRRESERLTALVGRGRDDGVAAARRRYAAKHVVPAPRVRWVLSWRLAGIALGAVAMVVGGVVLRSELAAVATVELTTPLPWVSTASASVAQGVTVHVAGAVVSPGLVDLSSGTRVADAVDAAGGATGDADLSALNLARFVVDGEQVVVPVVGQVVVPGAGTSGLVNLNLADEPALDGLPGIGPVLAQRIVEGRPFASVDDLEQIDGIGLSVLSRLRPLVTV